MYQAAKSELLDDGVQLTWQTPQDGAIDRYRILRSETSGGPYLFVGETISTTFGDNLAVEQVMIRSAMTTLHYVVQSVHANGSVSAYSDEVVYTPPSDVEMSLIPSKENLLLGEPLTVAIRVNTDGATIDTVAAHLEYDVNILRVVSVLPSTSLPQVSTSLFDNVSGTLDFVASNNSGVSGEFDAAVVTFTLLQATEETAIRFRFIESADSDVRNADFSVLDGTTDTAISINSVPTSVVVLRGVSAESGQPLLMLILFVLLAITNWQMHKRKLYQRTEF